MTRHGFYLAGGTALDLHLGHRRSVDLDWFTSARLDDPMRLAQEVRNEGLPFVTGPVERGTLHGSLFKVRVRFLEYQYPLLAPFVTWSAAGCLIVSQDDLACMKLSAVAQRGAKKDFVDIYSLGRSHRPLEDMLRLYQRKYSVEDISHVLSGLVFFDDGERERMPRMLWSVDWRSIKRAIQEWVQELARRRLGQAVLPGPFSKCKPIGFERAEEEGEAVRNCFTTEQQERSGCT
jgi:hypothetical protein